MHIRPMIFSDRAGWDPLWQGYLTFYKASVDEKTTQQTFERLTSGTEPMGAFLALDETGRAVGAVHWILHRSCWTMGDYCYLQDLFVSAEARGKGLGRALIEAVYKAAREAGASRVYWLTHETNTTARALYDQLATAPGYIQYRKVF